MPCPLGVKASVTDTCKISSAHEKREQIFAKNSRKKGVEAPTPTTGIPLQ
jgi:hypothetical protein